jgi:hypothetical protein
MGYLIGEIIVCLLIAFVLGLIIGWLLKRAGCAREVAELEAALAALRARPDTADSLAAPLAAPDALAAAATATAAIGGTGDVDTADSAASCAIEQIEGIGPGYGKRLRGLSIDSTASLLQRCQDADGVAAVAEQVGIEQFVVAKWVCMADLLRVPGIDGQQAELLAWAGVDSAQDLSQRKPEILARALVSTNAQENRTVEAPEPATVAGWVEAAGSLTS